MVNKILEIYKGSTGVSIDTRTLKSDNIFFALKGPNFDGNKYAKQALELGALAVVIDNPEYYVDDDKYLLVDDVLITLQTVARLHRSKMDIPVLAITGTNGKTTTKELIAAVLSTKFKINFTQGNLNNHIGVPITLLSTTKDTDLLIVEMGANGVGDIEELCNIALPTHGIITNVGKAHLEGFGSVENIVKTKTELYRHLENGGTILYNEEDEVLTANLPTSAKAIGYKVSKINKLSQDKSDCVHVEYENQILESKLVGDYNIQNMACALAVGKHFNIETHAAVKAIADYEPRIKRSQYIERSGHRFILDAYNANPTSMQNSIASFAKIQAENKILILGEMLEMGKYSIDEHGALLDLIREYDWKNVWLVGKEFLKVKLSEDHQWFEDVAALNNWYCSNPQTKHAYFLIKGSRGVQLEKFLTLFD